MHHHADAAGDREVAGRERDDARSSCSSSPARRPPARRPSARLLRHQPLCDSPVQEEHARTSERPFECRPRARPSPVSRRLEEQRSIAGRGDRFGDRSESKWNQLRPTQTALDCRIRTQISGICRVVVPAVAGSNPVAHPPRRPCKGATAAGTAAEPAGEPPPRFRGDEPELFLAFNDELIRSVSRAVRASREDIEDACSFAWVEVLRVEPIAGEWMGHRPCACLWSPPAHQPSRAQAR